VLKGETRVEMRRAVAGSRKASRTRATPAGDLAAGDAGLFDRLKEWRRAEARGQGVPAYVIFHDATLAEIARRRPEGLVGLAGLAGLGARKLERYGASLLEVLAAG
jgi:ATP-dependent DNA helicase RecQ